MCGIVGLHLRNPELYPRLGELLTGMLCEMQDRGSDAAGVAVYGDPDLSPPGLATVSFLGPSVPPSEIRAALRDAVGAEVSLVSAPPTVLVSAGVEVEALRQAVREVFPGQLIVGFGKDVAVMKGTGHPRALAESFGLAQRQGWQGVGHTRMATESAVNPAGSHPYTVGPDQCLVHNGSFSNHASIRRELQHDGVEFDSENDTEVGARFVAQQLANGLDMETALKELSRRFDGFYTLLVSNADSFAVLRDAIACKPAVIAETADWVAMASEYRALAGLPGIESAHLWEPEPERIYVWTR